MVARYVMNAGSFVGKSHIKRSMPNQDFVTYEQFEIQNKNDFIVMVVADGVSACSKADVASKYIGETAIEVFRDYVKEKKDEFSLEQLKNCVIKIYRSYIEYIRVSEGDFQDYGTTLELVVIFKGTAYTLHAGDGLIFIMKRDGTVCVSSDVKHCGEQPGAVIPFISKDGWEFQEYADVSSVFISSDGVYSELIPPLARRHNFIYDASLMLPMIDRRAHKSLRAMKVYQEKFIRGELSDNMVYSSCHYLLRQKVLCGVDEAELKSHFETCRPYTKFGRSYDDISFVMWTDRKSAPKEYDIREFLPNYYQIWKSENKYHYN